MTVWEVHIWPIRDPLDLHVETYYSENDAAKRAAYLELNFTQIGVELRKVER